MSKLDALRQNYQKNKEEILGQFFTFLRFESVSSEPAYKQECQKCANWLEDYIKKIGFKTEQWPTTNHPVIYAENLHAGPDKPILLIYNHYDVQPVDPIELWESPPFEPTIRDGEIYARGAQDNKGQCFYVLQALKALMERDGKLPVNVKLCIEGEEECGSVCLANLLKEKAKQLKADYLAVVDMGLPHRDTPAITLGVRGIVTMDLIVEGPNTDMHSGTHGGVVRNPIQALVELLYKLHDATGKVAVPGFYDGITPISAKEKEQINFTFDNAHYKKTFGVDPHGGEKGIPTLERAWLQPTIEINGINGGYSGAGFKTVIPSKAIAKLSCRLVPDMDPHHVGTLVADFLKKHAPEGVKVTIDPHPGGGKAVRASPHSGIARAFSEAYTDVFNKPCECCLGGGSIPIVTDLADASQTELVLMGLGLDDDKIHAPNEHFGIDRLEKGHLIIARMLEILGDHKK